VSIVDPNPYTYFGAIDLCVICGREAQLLCGTPPPRRTSIIGDDSRLVYSDLYRDEHAETVPVFVGRALAFFAEHAVHAKRLQTDNAWVYVKDRSLVRLLAADGIEHRRIPPRTPKRNGKVERYQQTHAREWAYGQRYRNSDARAAALPIWITHYNTTRNHSSVGNQPPITRVRNDPRQNN
jgi:hypothetical protein